MKSPPPVNSFNKEFDGIRLASIVLKYFKKLINLLASAYSGFSLVISSKSGKAICFNAPSSYINDGYAVLYLKSGGADAKRPITLRIKKDGNWVLWSDSILGILSDIRPPEKDNPWG